MNIAYLWVALGGAIGSVGRYWLGDIIASRFGAAAAAFPLGTLVINVTGSFLIGIFAALTIPEGRMDSQARTLVMQLLMTGVCGGYTTISSFSWQTLKLVQERQWLYAGGNVALSVILCMIAVWLGYLLGSVFNTAK